MDHLEEYGQDGDILAEKIQCKQYPSRTASSEASIIVWYPGKSEPAIGRQLFRRISKD